MKKVKKNYIRLKKRPESGLIFFHGGSEFTYNESLSLIKGYEAS